VLKMDKLEIHRCELKKDRDELLGFFRGMLFGIIASLGLWVLIILFLLWLFGRIA